MFYQVTDVEHESLFVGGCSPLDALALITAVSLRVIEATPINNDSIAKIAQMCDQSIVHFLYLTASN